MDEREYMEHLNRLRMVYLALKDIRLQDLLDKMSFADAIGSILDPTLYRDKGEALHEEITMVRTMMNAWKLAQKMQ